MLLGLSACASESSAPFAFSSDISDEERADDVMALQEGERSSSDASEFDAQDALDGTGEVASEFASERVEDSASDGLSVADQESQPPLSASCDIEVRSDDALQKELKLSFEGYEENVFGAAIYGHMLKIWLSEGKSALEILIRMDQSVIPGEIVPGVPGEQAWLVMILDDSQVFSTQPPSGRVTLFSCPDESGELIAGLIEDVVLFDMGTMMPVTVSGSFEVVLGEVEGEPLCTGL